MTTAAPTAADNRSIAALAENLRPALLRLSRRLRNAALKGGLSAQDVVVLALVSTRPGIGVSALAETEQTSKPTMSGQIKRLEAGGLVARVIDTEDARRSGLTLTPAGLRELEQVRAQRNDWLAKRLAGLEPAERAQIAAAATALLKLASAD